MWVQHSAGSFPPKETGAPRNARVQVERAALCIHDRTVRKVTRYKRNSSKPQNTVLQISAEPDQLFLCEKWENAGLLNEISHKIQNKNSSNDEKRGRVTGCIVKSCRDLPGCPAAKSPRSQNRMSVFDP